MDYSQGFRGTQGKIAKKAGKMQIFEGRVEITAKTAVRTHAAARPDRFLQCAGLRLSNENANAPPLE